MKAKIAEFFKSIQGEGKYAGCAQVFVRFFGCNLSCSYCDTELTFYQEYDPQVLADKVLDFNLSFVALTGGEPLVQVEALTSLASILKEKGCTLLLETNGTLWKPLEKVIDLMDVISCDLKLKSSTKEKAQWSAHQNFFDRACKKDLYFKTVICTGTEDKDIEKTADFLKDKKNYTLYLQPEAGKISKTFLFRIFSMQEYLLKKGIDARVMPQLHKLLGIK